MLKKLKLKKSIITLVLLGGLVLTNAIPVFAGSDRIFSGMTIRSFYNTSQLQDRAKETDYQYSWVQISSMSGVSAVDVKINQGDVDCTSWYKISKGDTTWKKLVYNNECGQPGIGIYVHLSACNDSWSFSSGSIAGVVDYE